MHRECFSKKGWEVLRAVKGIVSVYDGILAGGTGLAFQLGHRLSVDLDFFTSQDFDNEKAIGGIRKTNLSYGILKEEAGTLVSEINGVKFSLFHYEYPFENTLDYEGIRIANILDIAAMKIIAICQRGTKRDFVDLYFILQEVPFFKIAEHAVKKYGKSRINPAHIGKSLTYFADAESNPEPRYVNGKAVEWKRIKEFFKKRVKQFVLDF